MSDVLEIPFLAANGRIPPNVWDRLAEAVRLQPGKRFVLTLKEQKRKRSLNQNAYLWGVVYPAIVAVFREHGNNVDAEDVHDFLKDRVGKLKQHFITPDGEVLTGPGSTAKLTTTEFEAYLDKVRTWAAETLGIVIPLPNETTL